MDQAQAKAVKPVVQFIDRLQQTGGLKGTDIANFTGVSKATVSRGYVDESRDRPEVAGS